jgi:hypothetical protein
MRVTGKHPPRLTDEMEELLKLCFIALQVPFAVHAPADRKNFMSYSYVLFSAESGTCRPRIGSSPPLNCYTSTRLNGCISTLLYTPPPAAPRFGGSNRWVALIYDFMSNEHYRTNLLIY